jgi:hypothetical protein
MNAKALSCFSVLAVGVACGTSKGKSMSSPMPAAHSGASGGAVGANLGNATPIAEECQAFPLVGLQYSPGGSVLPNKCAPFDPTTNNPYAVRCIDAMPAFKTAFPGDQYCILPPPPDQGIQVGLHPQGKSYWDQMWAGDYSGYDNPSADWLLQPGQEVTQNYHGSADNPDKHNYYRTYFRMRTGSHHNIITLNDNSTPFPDGWIPLTAGTEASPAIFNSNMGSLLAVLGGQERPDDGQPATLDKPPEDNGYYLSWPASPGIVFNMHHFNPTGGPVLREGWVNIWWETDARVLENWYMGLDSNEPKTMNIAPGSVVDLHYSWTIPSSSDPIRLVRVFGHRHFWTTNFTSWIERAGSNAPEVIYQSFDWFNMPTYRYDSLAQNPTPVPGAHGDGAASGIVMLNPGDKLHFNCHIEYTDQRAATNGNAPNPESAGNLRFKNEVYGGEMCIQYGNWTGSQLLFPAADSSPIPDVATQ